MVNKYVNSFDTCARNKTPRHKPHGQLHPLPVPPAPWSSVSMDFIVELPRSKGWICDPCLRGPTHQDGSLLPYHDPSRREGNSSPLPKTCVQTPRPSRRHRHGRGTQFTSRFTASLLELCNIHSNKSTAFHPQSDGQTERVNKSWSNTYESSAIINRTTGSISSPWRSSRTTMPNTPPPACPPSSQTMAYIPAAPSE